MATMNISLPDELKAFVDQQLQHGYSTASEYVRELIRQAKREAESKKLDGMLLAGLESLATPMTDDDWARLRKQAETRWAKRGRGGKRKKTQGGA